VLVGSNMRRVASLGDDSGLGPFGTVSIQLMTAVCLVIGVALSAVETRVGLSTNTNSLSGLDQGDLWTDAQSCTDDFCGGGYFCERVFFLVLERERAFAVCCTELAGRW